MKRYLADVLWGLLFGMLIFTAIVGWVLIGRKAQECRAADGVLVRGVWTYECVPGQADGGR